MPTSTKWKVAATETHAGQPWVTASFPHSKLGCIGCIFFIFPLRMGTPQKRHRREFPPFFSTLLSYFTTRGEGVNDRIGSRLERASSSSLKLRVLYTQESAPEGIFALQEVESPLELQQARGGHEYLGGLFGRVSACIVAALALGGLLYSFLRPVESSLLRA